MKKPTKKKVKRRGRFTRKYRGGDRDTFRDSFLNIFGKLSQRVPLYQTVDKFVKLFKRNQTDINTLIPINYSRQPVNKYERNESPITDFVSIPVVLIYNISDYKQLKILINAFIENKGDIGLPSTRNKITAYGAAKPNPTLMEFINRKLQPTIKIPIKQKKKEKFFSAKGFEEEEYYPAYEEPQLDFTESDSIKFWSQLFSPEDFRSKLQEIKPPTVKYALNTCQIIQAIIPAHHIPEKPAIYNIGKKGQPLNPNEPIVQESPQDFMLYYTNVCATMLICAFLSNCLDSYKYNIIFKGGKAIQLVVEQPYETDDVDIMIVSDNEDETRLLAGHIGAFIKWCLPDNRIVGDYINDIYKLGYAKGAYVRAFCDISYKNTRFFSQLTRRPFHISELDADILFRIQTKEEMIREKLFYYTKYLVCEDGADNCDYYKKKFKRGLLALISPDDNLINYSEDEYRDMAASVSASLFTSP